MKTTINVRGIHEHEAVKLSDSIRNYINEISLPNIEKLIEHVKEPIFLNITIDVYKPHPHHDCDLRIHAPHFEIIVKKEGPELYKVIDDVFDETKRQLIRHKQEKVDNKKDNR